MDILIIDHELPAAERLQLLLMNYDPSIQVLACIESIEDFIQWLQLHPAPDLVFVDLPMDDGNSFEIFKKIPLQIPVIFTTRFNNYAIDAFRLFTIDYLLKPVTAESLGYALNKFRNFSFHFGLSNYHHLSRQVKENFTARYKNRFLAKVGSRSFFLQSDDVGYFFADNKIVYLVDKEGNRFIINFTLDKLEALLDPHHFFRINRKTIIHAKAIEQVKPYFNNRLKLFLKGIKTEEEILISRERVSAFKEWADA